jgi:hypothetical protein
MCPGAGIRLAVLLCACLVGGGAVGACGGGGDDEEVTLGAETSPSQAERNDAKIRELERRLSRRERRARAANRDSARAVGGGDGAGVLVSGASASFDALAGSLGDEIGISVGPVGSSAAQQLGSLQSGSAWSTIKVPIATRIVEDAGGPDALPATTRDLIARAITASDNDAAASLWEQLGGGGAAAGAVGELLAAAGDGETVVSTVGRDGFSPYGQTEWSLAAQQRLMSALAAGCVAPAATAELRALMGQVVADQRWGLGSTSAQAYFKGGWGPGTDGRYLVRQLGVLEQDGGAVSVAIATIPPDGQFATGTAALTQVAQWVADNVDWSAAAPRGC